MGLRSYLLLGVVSVIFFSGCSVLQEKNILKTSKLPKVENQFQPKIEWSASVGNGTSIFYSNLHPAFKDDTVYAADRWGIVKALDVNNGKLKWKINLSKKKKQKYNSVLLSGGITAYGESIYIGSEYGVVYSINKNTGNVIWKSQVIGEVLSNPVITNNLVLVHTSKGILQALDQKTGNTEWTVDLGCTILSLRGESEPAVFLENVIVGDDNGYLNVVLLDQGQITWQQSISPQKGINEIERLNDVDTTPIIHNDIVYALAYNGNLVAMNIHSGKILWKEEIGGTKKIIYDKNYIYCIDQDDKIYELNANNGRIIWKQSNLFHRQLTSPILFNKYLIMGDSKGYLHWINVVDGSFVVQQKIDKSGFEVDPILVNKDKIIFQSKNGKVYAIIH